MDLDHTSSGSEVAVPAGETVRIRLGENPTTGYRWELTEKGEPVLELKEDLFERPPDPKRIGAGGTRVLVFTAATSGTASLRFTYRRAATDAGSRTYTLQVRVPDETQTDRTVQKS